MITKIYTSLTVLTLTFFVPLGVMASPPAVSGVIAGQQTASKLVNISYNLAVDGNQTVYVELWFSPNNGLTFPIRCQSVTGHAGPGVGPGAKSVVWDAGADWDGQFTPSGRIRVIATYGSEPSGFKGASSSNPAGGNSSQADSSLLTVAWDQYWFYADWEQDPNNIWQDYSNYLPEHFADNNSSLGLIKVDPNEVSNAKWNEVATWGLNNGYTLLPLMPAEADPELPASGITFWQALKWCNARSEKEGLEPAYYLDLDEAIGDRNGDGLITNGPDTFEAHVSSKDLNMNGDWDPGEPFTDANQNGTFDPLEFVDINNNGVYDPGLTQVFRQGASHPTFGQEISTGDPNVWFSSVSNSIRWNSNGYRLPASDLFFKLSTGGNHKKKWPWGDQSPAEFANFDIQVIATITGGPVRNGPLTPDLVQPNGYGLKNLLGNVGEWGEYAHISDPNNANPTANAEVFGGSYLGLNKVGETLHGPPDPVSMFNLMFTVPSTTNAPGIGLRCVRYKE